MTDPDDSPLARCRVLLSGIASHARMLDEALPDDRALGAWCEAHLEGLCETLRHLLELTEERGNDVR